MAELQSIKIISKENNRIQIEVSIIHHDEHYIITDTNFVLQVLLSFHEHQRLNGNKNFNHDLENLKLNDSQGSLVSSQNIVIDNLIRKMKSQEIPVSKEEYEERIKQNNFAYKDQNVISLGTLGDSYSLSLEPAYDVFCSEAERHIQLVEVLSVQNFPHWFNRVETFISYDQINYDFSEELYETYKHEPTPSYILQITINPDSLFLISHLEVGHQHHSALYNFTNYTKSYKPTKKAIFHTLAYSSEISIPSDEQLISWWGNMEKEWQIIFKMNLYIQQVWIFPQIKTQFHGRVFEEAFEASFGKEYLQTLLEHKITISELRQMSQIKIIYLGNICLKNLEPLCLLKDLKVLHSEETSIEKIETLSKQDSLEDLCLIFSGIKPNLTCLKNLKRLQKLCLQIDTQEEFEIITNMTHLRHLRIYSSIELKPHPLKLMKQAETISICTRNMTGKKEPEIEKVIGQLRNNGINISWESEFVLNELYELIYY